MENIKKLIILLDSLIAESKIKNKSYEIPKCHRCGTQKVVDIFKGECNDWC